MLDVEKIKPKESFYYLPRTCAAPEPDLLLSFHYVEHLVILIVNRAFSTVAVFGRAFPFCSSSPWDSSCMWWIVGFGWSCNKVQYNCNIHSFTMYLDRRQNRLLYISKESLHQFRTGQLLIEFLVEMRMIDVSTECFIQLQVVVVCPCLVSCHECSRLKAF